MKIQNEKHYTIDNRNVETRTNVPKMTIKKLKRSPDISQIVCKILERTKKHSILSRNKIVWKQ